MVWIEFAPLNIPLSRRLQTAAVVQWVFSFLFLGSLSAVAKAAQFTGPNHLLAY